MTSLDTIRAKVEDVRARHTFGETSNGERGCEYCDLPGGCDALRWAEAALKTAEALAQYTEVPIDDEWLAAQTLAEIAEEL